jgi:hypothetical protein
MDKYAVRNITSSRYVVMQYNENTGQYTDFATVEEEYWAHRIADALIFEETMSRKEVDHV